MIGDCAAFDGWGQSANALSAVGYLVAAGFLVWWVVRGRLPPTTLILAGATAFEGVGSLLAHGVSGDDALLLHDLALMVVVGYMAGWHLGRLRGGSLAGAFWGSVLATVAGGAIWPRRPGITGVVAALAVGGVVFAEVVARRSGLAAVWTGRLLVVAVVAALAWLAGRTGSPLCDAESVLQPHALWHLLTAYLVVAWARRAAAADHT